MPQGGLRFLLYRQFQPGVEFGDYAISLGRGRVLKLSAAPPGFLMAALPRGSFRPDDEGVAMGGERCIYGRRFVAC